MTSWTNPEFLVETEWLAAQLDDPTVRVFDCTVFLRPDGERGYRIEPGREAWAKGHIPGSGFADLHKDLSDTNAALRFMRPSAEQFTASMRAYGVNQDSRVVLYDSIAHMWAARVWWLLRSFGFDNAAVLNGGWKKWTAEGRATSTEEPSYGAGNFEARPRAGLMADKAEVLAATADGATCLVNALTAEQHAGTGGAGYGRPGHIPGSVNVPAFSLVDEGSQAYLEAETVRERLAGAGALKAGRVITYCGGGIAASSVAFALTLLGHENVAVYDASMSEWAADESLPMETG